MRDAPLRMLLPCKPDQARREVRMAELALTLSMQGCDAGGGTFAVSHVLVHDLAQASAVLALWKAAVLSHVHATGVSEQAFSLAGGWNSPLSVRLQANGLSADGAAVALHAAWFAQVDATGVHLFHAALFAPQAMPDAAETFMSNLVLR